jgi:hypothetical protein
MYSFILVTWHVLEERICSPLSGDIIVNLRIEGYTKPFHNKNDTFTPYEVILHLHLMK